MKTWQGGGDSVYTFLDICGDGVADATKGGVVMYQQSLSDGAWYCTECKEPQEDCRCGTPEEREAARDWEAEHKQDR